MTSQPWIIIALLFVYLTITIEAQPKCTLYNEKDRVCTAGNKDYVLRRGLVSDNNKTTAITLRDCRITDVDFESFDALPLLTYIDLSKNKIQKLKLGVLDGAMTVTYLNLSYNLISEFPLGLFDQEPNLEVLDLKGNAIHTLVLGIFDPLSKLRHLDLSSNAFLGTNLSPFLFDISNKIQFMDFSQNNMQESPSNLLHAFQELIFLNLDRCSLTEMPKFLKSANLKTMKHLMLSTNQITRINDPAIFGKLINLDILNLAFNLIENVHQNVFKSLTNLKTIHLNNNKLKEIPDNLFRSMGELRTINLSHNLIEFIPVNAFRGSGVKNLNLADNRFSYLTDNFILELKNSGTILSKFYFNQNPWQCTCLIQLLNEVKSMRVEYNSQKYNGRDTVCVAKSDFYCKKHKTDNDIFLQMYYNPNKL